MAPCQCNTWGLNGKELALNWSDLRVLARSFAATAAIIEFLQKSDWIFTTHTHARVFFWRYIPAFLSFMVVRRLRISARSNTALVKLQQLYCPPEGGWGGKGLSERARRERECVRISVNENPLQIKNSEHGGLKWAWRAQDCWGNLF